MSLCLLALELKFHLELVQLRGGSSASGASHSAELGQKLCYGIHCFSGGGGK